MEQLKEYEGSECYCLRPLYCAMPDHNLPHVEHYCSKDYEWHDLGYLEQQIIAQYALFWVSWLLLHYILRSLFNAHSKSRKVACDEIDKKDHYCSERRAHSKQYCYEDKQHF